MGDLLEEQGVTVEGYEWVYGGFPRSHPFEPHQDLDGLTFENFDDPALENTSGFPATSHYLPGDHAGCVCDVMPVLVETGTSSLAGVIEKAAAVAVASRVISELTDRDAGREIAETLDDDALLDDLLERGAFGPTDSSGKPLTGFDGAETPVEIAALVWAALFDPIQASEVRRRYPELVGVLTARAEAIGAPLP